MDESTLTASPQRFRVDDLEIDLDAESVLRNGVPLDLPELSFRLLVTLVLAAPDRVTKDDLVREVWDDVVVSDETLAAFAQVVEQSKK